MDLLRLGSQAPPDITSFFLFSFFSSLLWSQLPTPDRWEMRCGNYQEYEACICDGPFVMHRLPQYRVHPDMHQENRNINKRGSFPLRVFERNH